MVHLSWECSMDIREMGGPDGLGINRTMSGSISVSSSTNYRSISNLPPSEISPETVEIDRGQENGRESDAQVSSICNSTRYVEDESYWVLLRTNRPLRLYMSSYIVSHFGEWFTYVASISLIESLLGEDAGSKRSAISVLVVVRLIPYVIWSPIGGSFADSKDRRIVMIGLDCLGALVPLLYLVAYHAQSIVFVYMVAFCQHSIASIYEPSRASFVPLLVTNEASLKKAVTLSGIVWSTMTAIGSSLGGFTIAFLGVEACFLLDCFTYMGSAYLLWTIGGTWNVSPEIGEANNNDSSNIWYNIVTMTVESVNYLRRSFFGPLVFMKGCDALVYGASDILNVALADQGIEQEDQNNVRMGTLFGCVGIGCFLGPIVANNMTDMKNPKSLQLACVWAFGLLGVGYLGIGISDSFIGVCFFSAIRAAGSDIAWINSELLLQKFTEPGMLGRVVALDYAIAEFSEGVTAVLAGVLQDKYGMSARAVALVMAAIAAFFCIVWLTYHVCGRGAGYYLAREKGNACSRNEEDDRRILS